MIRPVGKGKRGGHTTLQELRGEKSQILTAVEGGGAKREKESKRESYLAHRPGSEANKRGQQEVTLTSYGNTASIVKLEKRKSMPLE